MAEPQSAREPEVLPDPPAPAPAPAASRPTIVTCPSCGSQYNAESCELVQDTKLREKIRDLERQVDGWRANYQNVEANAKVKIETLQREIDELRGAPAPETRRQRDFIVA
jgi:hypothetical protein